MWQKKSCVHFLDLLFFSSFSIILLYTKSNIHTHKERHAKKQPKYTHCHEIQPSIYTKPRVIYTLKLADEDFKITVIDKQKNLLIDSLDFKGKGGQLACTDGKYQAQSWKV